MEEPFVGTASGGRLHFLNPDPHEFRITDIAHQLSHTCRWSGATRCFFSVAQHSLMVADGVERALGSKHEILQALLHDAAEAYVGDLARPIKHATKLKGYAHLEGGLKEAILEKYTQEGALAWIVKDQDERAQHTEGAYLLNYRPGWILEGKVDHPLATIHCRKVLPVEIRRRFLDKFLSLM